MESIIRVSLHDVPLSTPSFMMYLGIRWCRSDFDFTEHDKIILFNAKKKFYAMKYFFKSKFRISPMALAKHLYLPIVRPTLEYAQQVLIFNHSTIQKFEKFQVEVLNACLGTKNIAGHLVRYIFRVTPLNHRWIALKHKFVRKVDKGKQNFVREILCGENVKCSYIKNLLKLASEAPNLVKEAPDWSEYPFLKTIDRHLCGKFFFWWLYDFEHSSNLRNRTWLIKFVCAKTFEIKRQTKMSTLKQVEKLAADCDVEALDSLLKWNDLPVEGKLKTTVFLLTRNSKHETVSHAKVLLWKKVVSLLRETMKAM